MVDLKDLATKKMREANKKEQKEKKKEKKENKVREKNVAVVSFSAWVTGALVGVVVGISPDLSSSGIGRLCRNQNHFLCTTATPRKVAHRNATPPQQCVPPRTPRCLTLIRPRCLRDRPPLLNVQGDRDRIEYRR